MKEQSPEPRFLIPNFELTGKTQIINSEETQTGKIKKSLLWNYVTSRTNFCGILGLISVFALAQTLGSLIDWWISYWTSHEEMRSFSSQTGANETHETDWYVGVYGILVAALVLVAFMRSFLFVHMMFKSSQKLHDGMFNGIVNVSKPPVMIIDYD